MSRLAALAAVGVMLTLTGCGPTATPEEQFLNSAETVLTGAGLAWTPDVAAATLRYGKGACEVFHDGLSLALWQAAARDGDRIMGPPMAEVAGLAQAYLCPETSR